MDLDFLSFRFFQRLVVFHAFFLFQCSSLDGLSLVELVSEDDNESLGSKLLGESLGSELLGESLGSELLGDSLGLELSEFESLSSSESVDLFRCFARIPICLSAFPR